MSKFTEFYNHVVSDPKFGAAFAKIIEEQKIPAGTPFENFTDENFTALLPLAKEMGLEFTLAEAKAHFSGSELSDDELEAVAGGSKGANQNTAGDNSTQVHCTAIGGESVQITYNN
ncbi:MAG: hypothetical protein LBC86_10365 [Oscillospiraceae bacterium]|jgi:hypothetical protein|nr:hypothetical protein [Oscillospiraceae bacterium]